MTRRRQQLAWCLFDFANSAFNTVVITFVYSAFFAVTLVGEQTRGDVLWARMMSVSGLAIAVLAPVVGARADRSANKRAWLMVLSLVVVACAAALTWPAPDAATGKATAATIWTALVIVGVANVAFELVFVFYNAFLPQLAEPGEVGRLSGKGWAFGYLGGLLCLAVCLGVVGFAGIGPWVSTEHAFHVRATNLVVAAWFAVFALPMFVWVRDEKTTAAAAPRRVLHDVLATLRRLPQQPHLLRFLIAHLIYNDALMALIALAGLYMAGTLQMAPGEVMATAIGLNVLAGAGALVFGRLDDRLGPRTVILASLALLLAGGILAVAVPTKSAFFVAAALVGLGMGPNQSASRTLLARLAEGGRSAEYFGLFAMSGKATVWLGPLLYSIVVDVTHSQRAGFVPLLVMFAAGAFLLRGLRAEGEAR
jgi:UMF1 family MFS transporter